MASSPKRPATIGRTSGDGQRDRKQQVDWRTDRLDIGGLGSRVVYFLRLVAGVMDSPGQAVGSGLEHAHVGALEHQIDGGTLDAGDCLECALDRSGAAGTAHAVDGKPDRADICVCVHALEIRIPVTGRSRA